jgi:hypothetical protein
VPVPALLSPPDDALWKAVHQHAFGGPPPEDDEFDLFDDGKEEGDEKSCEDEAQSRCRWRELTFSILVWMKRKWPDTWRDVGHIAHEEWLSWAIQKGHVRIVLPLLRHSSTSELENLPPSLMVAAGGAGSLELLALLYPHVGINAEDNRGLTALHLACLHGHTEAVRFLLAHGAAVDKATYDGKTALMYAAEGGFEQITAALLAQGASVNLCASRDLYFITALRYATRSGSLATVRALVQAGGQAASVLHYAEERGHLAIVNYLATQIWNDHK